MSQNSMLNRTTGVVKIGDFGLSKALQFTGEVSTARLGIPLYHSPEVMRSLEYTRKTGVWGLGVAFYRMMVNKFSFPASSVDKMCEKCRKERPMHPRYVRDEYSEPLGDLVVRMLVKSRTKRPDVCELLALPLFKEVLNECP